MLDDARAERLHTTKKRLFGHFLLCGRSEIAVLEIQRSNVEQRGIRRGLDRAMAPCEQIARERCGC